jgi:cytoplasmic iron level regulating protein YaaA (DUF328/UPF0246 family)
VRMLLPPSEAKLAGGGGPSLRVAGWGSRLLGPARREVIEAVVAMCAVDKAAAALLKLPPSRAEADLAANAAMLDAPTVPALERFTGVLYAGLDVATFSGSARLVADSSVMIVSGAFGLLGADEAVPDHRVGMAVTVPGIGALTPWWRTRLKDVVPSLFAGDHLVVDLRSTDYAAVLTPTGPLRGRTVPVRVLTEKKAGRARVRRVISYPSKYTKGLLARELILLEAGGHPIATIDDVETAAGKAGLQAERRRGPGGQTALDLIVPDTVR